MSKRIVNIGDCDTCDYCLKCTRCSCTGPSLLKQMFGCPKELVEQAKKDMEESKDE